MLHISDAAIWKEEQRRKGDQGHAYLQRLSYLLLESTKLGLKTDHTSSLSSFIWIRAASPLGFQSSTLVRFQSTTEQKK